MPAIKRTTASGAKRITIVKSKAYVNHPSNVTKKKPTARLKKRRAANTVKGRYPNPSVRNEDVNYFIDEAIASVDRASIEKKQATLSYAQGMITGFYFVGLISKTAFETYINSLRLRTK